jgi:hypothetical protein
MGAINQAILIFAAPQLTANGKHNTDGINLDVSVPPKLDGLQFGEGTMSDKSESESPVEIAARER